MKLINPIAIELDYLDEYGRTLKLGSYSKFHSGLELSNGNYIDCVIDVVEYTSVFNKIVSDVKIFDPSGLEILDFDEEEAIESVIANIVLV